MSNIGIIGKVSRFLGISSRALGKPWLALRLLGFDVDIALYVFATSATPTNCDFLHVASLKVVYDSRKQKFYPATITFNK